MREGASKFTGKVEGLEEKQEELKGWEEIGEPVLANPVSNERKGTAWRRNRSILEVKRRIDWIHSSGTKPLEITATESKP